VSGYFFPLKVANFNAAVLFCSDQKNGTNKSDPKPDGFLGNAFLDFAGSDEPVEPTHGP
jgi:hypothetical protein